ncbi:ATP-dependent DNA helicase [Mycobacteroides saopaulense]|uniref:DNA 5'-3' helicase n=1 Tax=Mycobacteroides saopaulense TaxID=1578165 RepID=A0ABX3BYM8_9MYCO|nr:ATP-dependent DNA helicase [Mycobacteroides saopaulense]OHT86996.1 ATP-dependent helicase [Mycobacteroides saopaulense]OHU08854.1 ATP-dependent helicase [Mycobacteroides saopaulense]
MKETDATASTGLLATAVAALGGTERAGQLTMATAVEHSLHSGEHLVVQAGTGTGKSLAYLVPAIAHAIEESSPVVVSTATIALQRQLVDRDLPRLADALTPSLARRPRFAILKGRGNYLCLNKLHNGAASDQEAPDTLFEPFAASALGRDVQRLNEWAEETKTGDRDELKPGVPDRSWSQVSVSARECLGATRCPFGTECFAELARLDAGQSDVVVTNHALLAIDAIADINILPEHDAVIVDEAHDLVDRVTSVATQELSAVGLTVTIRRIGRLVSPETASRFEASSATFSSLIHDSRPGTIDRADEETVTYLTALRDAAAAARTEIPTGQSTDPATASARSEAVAALDDIVDAASLALACWAEPDITARPNVVWLDHEENRGSVRPVLRVAPLSVAGLLRTRLFGQRTVVLTSATLALGGKFDAMAASWGLPAREPGTEPTAEPKATWHGIDVGSPFQHEKSAILYLARHLPAPGRDGLGAATLDEIETLVRAAGGRTLGLFSSMRAAKEASEEMRTRLDTPVLCQGDDATSVLVEQFSADPETSLFGTLSLWQGVDVPGPSLSLVLIDRIPFPRPDDPLRAARQRAISARGGNGFMAVAGTQAALLLAQGTGRLLRSAHDRGVVAILDSRMATAGYGGFLRASLPPFWSTHDLSVVTAALQRLMTKHKATYAGKGSPTRG